MNWLVILKASLNLCNELYIYIYKVGIENYSLYLRKIFLVFIYSNSSFI